jgi:hypothetical protein
VETPAVVASLKDAASTQQKSGIPRSLAQEDNSPPRNGEIHINGVTESKTERNVDTTMPSLTDNRSKSRFPILFHPSIILCAYCFCKCGVSSDINKQEPEHEC